MPKKTPAEARKGRLRTFQFYPEDDERLATIKSGLGLRADIDALREALKLTAKRLAGKARQ